MLLKSLIFRLNQIPIPMDEKNNAIKMLYSIIKNFDNPDVWKWQNKDHTTLIRHYDTIIQHINDNTINFVSAKDTILRAI
jgi:hypothetical protein